MDQGLSDSRGVSSTFYCGDHLSPYKTTVSLELPAKAIDVNDICEQSVSPIQNAYQKNNNCGILKRKTTNTTGTNSICDVFIILPT